MSHLDAKMHAVHAASRLFADAPYQNFRNDAAGRQHDNPAAPLYELRALGQLEYAYRLCKARPDVDAACVERAADAALASFSACGALTPEAAQQTEQALLPLEQDAKRYTVHLVAHAHIDMNWMWPWHETVAVTLETFRTMLKLMEEDPDFTFSQSQASCYRIVEQFEPEMLQRIRQRVHEGRWEVTASTWVEADKNMPNLESMAHHLLYTKQYLSGLLDIDPATLNLDYEPDTFGHSENVPEILSQGGVKYYYHCRGFEGEALYNWQAPSGASVLAVRDHTWYLGDMSPNFAAFVPQLCEQYGITEYLRVYGVGDHGGGPTRQDLSYIHEMQTWPVFPKMIFSNYRAFYGYLEQHKEQLPVVRQELNPVFTGCYTTQSRTKMANRVGEAVLAETQALSAAAQTLTGRKPNLPAIEEGWRNILFNQFHDILPGSGVRDTREFAMTKFSETMALAGTEYTAAMRAIAGRIDTSGIEVVGDAAFNKAEGAGVGFGSMQYRMPVAERGGALTRIYHLFNPAPQQRTENVRITVWDWAGDLAAIRFTDAAGAELPCQLLTPEPIEYVIHKYIEVLVRATVPAQGWTTVVMNEQGEAAPLALPKDPRLEKVDDYTLENELIRARFDPITGQMVSLTDKATGRELLHGPAGFRFIEEDPSKGQTSWVVGRYQKREPLTQGVRLRGLTRGALRSCFELEAPFGKGSRVVAQVSLDAGARRVDYDVKVEFNEVGTKDTIIPQLAFAAPLGYDCSEALYDVPAGAQVRKAAAQDLPASSFMAALDRDGGAPLAMSTDSKYGFRCFGNEAQVTLVRGAFDPDPYSDRGDHQFRVCVHAPEDACPMGLSRAAFDAVRPIHVLSGGRHEGDLPGTFSFVTLGWGDVQLSGVKPAEDGDGVIVRLYDIVGKGGDAQLTFGAAPASVTRTDVLETADLGALPVQGNTVKVPVAPHAVVCLRVRF